MSQYRQRLAKSGSEFERKKDPAASGRELDRKWQSVKLATDVSYGESIVIDRQRQTRGARSVEK
jgi:hypothetical protein